jgi:hypothetical protein
MLTKPKMSLLFMIFATLGCVGMALIAPIQGTITQLPIILVTVKQQSGLAKSVTRSTIVKTILVITIVQASLVTTPVHAELVSNYMA